MAVVIDFSAATTTRLAARTRKPVAIVIHTTGGGVVEQAERAMPSRPADVIDTWIANHLIRPDNKLFAGYLVGRDGMVWRLATDDRVCNHSAPLGTRYDHASWRLYGWPMDADKLEGHGRDGCVVYDWWDARWGRDASPADLPTGTHPNAASLSIDLIPTRGTYTTEQTAACRALVAALCERHGIPRDRGHVLAHADVDPQRRGILRGKAGLIGKDWDPGALDWAALGLAS